jgi:hypothetical protein
LYAVHRQIEEDTMESNAYEKKIGPGGRGTHGEPCTRAVVESFVKGFGLSAAATRRIVDEWMADQERAKWEAYDEGYQSGLECSS